MISTVGDGGECVTGGHCGGLQSCTFGPLMEITMTDYAGIDYGLGFSNVDTETGIRYGIISQNAVTPESLDDIYTSGEDVGFQRMREQAKDELARAISNALSDYADIDADAAAAEIIDVADWHCCDEGGPYEYSGEGYHLRTTSDNELWVLKSRFYTHAQFCSPCAPGAGHLGNPCPTGPKTYCLGPDWFEDGKVPYPIYEVESLKE